MKSTFAAIAIATLSVTSAAALAQDYAMRPPAESIEPVSRVLGAVTSRADFADFRKIAYDRWSHDYQVTYVADDGTIKVVRIDARSGEEKGN